MGWERTVRKRRIRRVKGVENESGRR